MAEHVLGGFGNVLVELQPRFGVTQEGRQLALPDFDRLATEVLAVDLDQVKRIQEHVPVLSTTAELSKTATPV